MSQSSTNPPETTAKKDHTLSIFIFCTGLVMIISGAVGFLATSVLLKLPKAESCPKIFSPLASASVRLYCAQLASEENTVSAWVEAISMVDDLPKNNSLGPEIDRNIEIWVKAILAQGETLFQSGKIEEAIKLTQDIPQEIPAYELVQTQRETWKSTWKQGEAKEQQVQQYIKTRNWNQAFREAAQLTAIDNQYWSTVKYEENLEKIQFARDESSKLESAYALVETGELDNLLAAMTEAEKFDSSSQAYVEAQELINEAKNEILKIIQAKVEERDWEGLEATLKKIPQEDGLNDYLQDWYQIAKAGTISNDGTVEGVEQAILMANTIEAQSPVYYDAQKLIGNWELEAEDIEILTEARKIGDVGTMEELEKAIAKAETIPAFHPRYQEAQTEISQWNRQIQVIEDQPILDRARQLSKASTVTGWQEAINQASLIGANRPLYPQAQEIIQQSRYNIQSSQNQPILDQAITQGNLGNWSEAIAQARQIPSGTALYPEAQKKIGLWQTQITAQENLEEAYRLGASNTVSDIAKAIELANQIPDYTSAHQNTQSAINQWSEKLLTLAQESVDYDLDEAIAIANLIPRNSSSYNSARTYIEIWKRKKSQFSLESPDSL